MMVFTGHAKEPHKGTVMFHRNHMRTKTEGNLHTSSWTEAALLVDSMGTVNPTQTCVTQIYPFYSQPDSGQALLMELPAQE